MRLCVQMDRPSSVTLRHTVHGLIYVSSDLPWNMLETSHGAASTCLARAWLIAERTQGYEGDVPLET